MLMIYFAIFTLFLTSRISALPAPAIIHTVGAALSTVSSPLFIPITVTAVGDAASTINLPLPMPAIAYSVGVPAPAIVYSAVIYNAQRSKIKCTVFRPQPSGPMLSFGPLTIRKKEYHLIKEVTYDMGTWTAAAIIQKIQCGHLVVSAPFANVTSPVKNWEFRVEKNKIVSVGPSSYNADN
ncbi:unnamed protein product [Rotaria socialis]|uniref:Uncharacterized protein n=1 Tax=Rotaria socialis TaxID=392032 RepID=A0A820V3A7_9BILA